MPLPRRKPDPQAEADSFNAKIKVGDAIDYREVLGEGTPTRYVTRSAASVLAGHTAVVWLVGKAGCVCIEHCEAANGPQFVTDRAAIEAAFFNDQAAEDAPATLGLR